MDIIHEILKEIENHIELEGFDNDNTGIREENLNQRELNVIQSSEIVFENIILDFIKESVHRVFLDLQDEVAKEVESSENSPEKEKGVNNKKRKFFNEVPYYESERGEQSEDEADSKELFPRNSEEIYSATYHKLWLERKVILEKEAERRARVTARQWQKEKVSLKKLIDDSLKEYIDLYEKAHALYLQFENEKTEFISRFQSKEFNNNLGKLNISSNFNYYMMPDRLFPI